MKVSAQCRSGGDDSAAHLLLTAYSNYCEASWLSCMSSCPDKSIQLVGKEQVRGKKKDNYLEPCCVCAIRSWVGVGQV